MKKVLIILTIILSSCVSKYVDDGNLKDVRDFKGQQVLFPICKKDSPWNRNCSLVIIEECGWFCNKPHNRHDLGTYYQIYVADSVCHGDI